MIDDLIEEYKETIEVEIAQSTFFFLEDGVWSLGTGDEDQMILEDEKHGITFTEDTEYNGLQITVEMFETAKSIVKEGRDEDLKG